MSKAINPRRFFSSDDNWDRRAQWYFNLEAGELRRVWIGAGCALLLVRSAWKRRRH